MFPRVLLRSRNWAPRIWKRRYFNDVGQQMGTEIPRVIYLRPVLWSAAAITLIYVNAAIYETQEDCKRNGIDQRSSPPSKTRTMTFRQIEAERLEQARAELRRRNNADISIFALTSMKAVETTWNSLTSAEKASWTAIGLNTTIYLSGKLYQPLRISFLHLPVLNRNWTLLTSAFGHGGPFHLLINMYVLNNMTLPVATSQSFQGSTPHCVAFYLSSGILSSLAYHLQSAVRPIYRIIPCLGASGAIYAMLGVFGMSYPDSKIGIIFLPFSFPAQQALAGIALIELYGTVFGLGLGLAHVSHLTGLAVGAGYVYFDGGTRVWGKLKQFLYEARTSQRVKAK